MKMITTKMTKTAEEEMIDEEVLVTLPMMIAKKADEMTRRTSRLPKDSLQKPPPTNQSLERTMDPPLDVHLVQICHINQSVPIIAIIRTDLFLQIIIFPIDFITQADILIPG
jgi:hypothetical protein